MWKFCLFVKSWFDTAVCFTKAGNEMRWRDVTVGPGTSAPILFLRSPGRKRTTGRAVRGGADQIHMMGPTPVSFFIPPHLISSRRPSSSSIQGPASSFLLRLLFVFLLLSLSLCWIPSLRRMRAGASPQRATRWRSMRAGMSPQRARRQRSPAASKGAAAGEAGGAAGR